MKLTKQYIPVITTLLILSLLLNSCTKSFDGNGSFETKSDFKNNSIVQVYMAMVNASRNYVYVDTKPVTGSLMTSGSVFPATGLGFNVDGGLRDFLVRDTLSATTQIPLSFAENLQANKSYTIFVYDTINSPKQKTVETNIVIPTDTTARMRFANFVFSKTDVPAIDIFSKRRNMNVFTNVPVTGVTDFIPFPSSFTDTFFVRETGTANLIGTLNTVSLQQKRSYTMVFRGRYQSTTGTVARTVSLFLNY